MAYKPVDDTALDSSFDSNNLEYDSAKKPENPFGFNYEDFPDYLNEEAIMAITGWSSKTLANKRSLRQIPFFKNECRKVIYPKKEIFNYLFSNCSEPAMTRKENAHIKVEEHIRKTSRKLAK